MMVKPELTLSLDSFLFRTKISLCCSTLERNEFALGHIEQGDTISNSGLNGGECQPCPQIEPIQQSSLQLLPEFNIIKTKIKNLSDKINRLGDSYRSNKLNTKDINEDLNKIKIT